MSNSLADAMIKSPKRLKTSNNVTDQAVNNNSNAVQNPFQISFRDLLELDEEGEQALLKEILSDDMQIPQEIQVCNNPVAISNSVTSTVNPVAMHNEGPRMVFNNSNVTINFNISK